MLATAVAWCRQDGNMDISAMILHVMQFADQPLSEDEIAARIMSDLGESLTREQVVDSIESSLFPMGRVLLEHGRYRLPEEVPSVQTEELARWPPDHATLELMLTANLDDCDRSWLFANLVRLDGVELEFAYAFQRRHLRICPNCRNQFPELEHRFLERDVQL